LVKLIIQIQRSLIIKMTHKPKAVLYPRDLSYADNYPLHDNVRWDTWSRFVERSAAYQPWMWCVGNHEVDWLPQFVSVL